MKRTEEGSQDRSSKGPDSLRVPAGDLRVGAVRCAREIGYAHLAGGVLAKNQDISTM